MAGTKIVTRRTASMENALVRSFVIPIVLVLSGVCAADILNPGFETIDLNKQRLTGRALPLSWFNSDHLSFNSYCTSLWCSEGLRSVAMFSRIGSTVAPGNFQGFYQSVDLTGMGKIKFDVNLEARPEGLFEHFEAVLLVDGVALWSRNTGGVYRDQEVNVSNLAGWHRIDLRLRAVDPGWFGTAYWSEWDNFRLIEKPAIIPAVIDLDPPILNPVSNGNWITGYLKLPQGQDVHLINGGTVTLNGVPAVIGQEGWATPEANAENVADFDNDGTLERMVKFDRAAIVAIVEPPEATVTVKGQLTDGIHFQGDATLGVHTVGGVKR